MFFRLLSVCAILALLTLPASGVSLNPVQDDNLAVAAARMKKGDIKGALEAAQQAPQSGMKDFMIGMAASRLEEWPEAAAHLASAAGGFPLLADYALYHQGNALYKQARFAEAQEPLLQLLKNHADSRLVRPGMLLLGEALFDSGDFKGAMSRYEQFVEKYPSGADSLSALLKSAICRIRLGDTTAAMTVLRSIWLNNPASPSADKAAEELQQLALKGIAGAPYTRQELFRRATTLYNQGKYSQAVKDLKNIPREPAGDDLETRIRLKTGQALYKSRQYREAEKSLAALLKGTLRKEQTDEALYWLAKAQDKNSKEEEAFANYLKIAENSPKSALADDALLQAAYIRKFENNWQDALPLLRRILTGYPNSSLIRNVYWEIAWASFQSKDYVTAADFFKRLADLDSSRDRALYWYGRSLARSGDDQGAKEAFSGLMTEFPLGYYALSYRKEANIGDEELATPVRNLAESLPLPQGFERIKALIALGFHQEAARELALVKQTKTPGAIARLYLEMDNYAGAIEFLKQERLRRPDRESIPLWNISYPLAYSDLVAKNAAANGIQQGLVYAIIRAESSFAPAATSPVGAVGLMQLMPSTAASVSGSSVNGRSSLTSPELNIRLGSRHLKDLLDLHKGDLVLAVAAYNAGSGNVAKWQKRYGALPKDEFIESIPFGETREYVKKVLSGIEIYQRLYRLADTPQGKPAPVVAQELPAG